MVRDPEEQVKRMGVPSEHLNGHAFHTYQLVSADGMYEVFLSCSLKVFECFV
jgi:4-hydroxy-tetrahydrodipicolinate reductase